MSAEYRVVVTENAKRNLRDYCLRAAESAPETAVAWLDRFEKSLQTLATHPERCSVAAEDDAVEEEIRQFRFGQRHGCYRVLFTIRSDEVIVLHIRRAVMDTANPEELFGK